MRGIGQKRRDEGDGDASASEKSGETNREFLEQKREESAGKAQSEAEEKGKPKGRVLAQMRSEFESNGKAERRDKKPKKATTEKEKGKADQHADNRQGRMHFERLGDRAGLENQRFGFRPGDPNWDDITSSPPSFHRAGL